MMYIRNASAVLIYMGFVLDGDFSARGNPDGTTEITWHIAEYPTPAEVAAQEKPWAAKKKRIEVKEWAAQLNSRAYETTLPDAVDNMLTQDVRQAFRTATNANTDEVNGALDTAFSSAVTAIETARDDPGNDLNTSAKKAVDAVLDGLKTLTDVIGSVVISNNESKDHFKTRSRFQVILMGGEARALMKEDINALRDDPTKTVADILAYVVDDANAGTIHAAEYPTESPTLAERLIQYPVDYDLA